MHQILRNFGSPSALYIGVKSPRKHITMKRKIWTRNESNPMCGQYSYGQKRIRNPPKMLPKSIKFHPKSIPNRPKWCPGAFRKQPWKPTVNESPANEFLRRHFGTVWAILGATWDPAGRQGGVPNRTFPVKFRKKYEKMRSESRSGKNMKKHEILMTNRCEPRRLQKHIARCFLQNMRFRWVTIFHVFGSSKSMENQ